MVWVRGGGTPVGMLCLPGIAPPYNDAMLEQLRSRAAALRTESYAVYLAARDPRTPWFAKALVLVIVAYALSPIDLIPDFIPVLGYLDDLVIVPAGIALALELIPDAVMAEARKRAATQPPGRSVRLAGAAIILMAWMLAIILLFWFIRRMLQAKP
jgi:uncharacterized membrane protein YkvA (DUF1232 family)